MPFLKKSKPSKVQTLQVLDRESLEDFLKEANQAWRSAHPQPKKNTGRPSAKQQVFEACKETLAKNGMKFPFVPLSGATPYRRWASFGDWVVAIQKQTRLHQHTVERHLTEWLLECDQKGLGLNFPLLKHVFRHNPKRAQEWRLMCKQFLERLPGSIKRLEKQNKTIRPYFTFNEMCAFKNSIDEVEALIEAGHSRNAILKKIKSGSFPEVRIEDFAPSPPSRK